MPTANIQLTHEDHRPSGKKIPVAILAHDIESPSNVGSLFRIADAMGVEKIYLTGNTPCPPNKKIKQSARSTEKYVAFAYEQDPSHVLAKLQAKHYRIVSLELTSTSISLKDFELKKGQHLCLIVGSENLGIAQELLDMSDDTVHIPMQGSNSSLNLANASAMALYQISNLVG